MSSSGIPFPAAEIDRAAWKTWINWTAAILTAALFLVAGLWKLTDPTGAAVRLAQAKVPEALSLLAAMALGVTETFAGVMVLLPRCRRWGAALASALLILFMLYIGFFYHELQGQECSCFPWVKRAVGPGFFIGDAIMLLLAAAAGIWARRPERVPGRIKAPVLILSAIVVFSLASYAVAASRQTGTRAPATIAVDGKPLPITSGKVFLYFFDPACMHCLEAGRKMAQLNWGDTRLIGVPVTEPQFGAYFMKKTGLNRPVSTDWELLKKTFAVKGTPGGVALDNGREKAELTRFEGNEPAATLHKLGFTY
ncbi:MAG: DoxX family membrane protein [Acidobacteriota bacterium]|nr:DoxX family membrane protein [Acidobacteriota bacterium]